MSTNTFSGFTSLFSSTFNHIGNIRTRILIGFGGIGDRFDTKRRPKITLIRQIKKFNLRIACGHSLSGRKKSAS